MTQAHSEKLPSDCCSNSLWIRPAHFLGGIASTLAGKGRVDEIRWPSSVRSKKIKRSQLTSTSELKLPCASSAARKQFQCVICCSIDTQASKKKPCSFGARENRPQNSFFFALPSKAVSIAGLGQTKGECHARFEKLLLSTARMLIAFTPRHCGCAGTPLSLQGRRRHITLR